MVDKGESQTQEGQGALDFYNRAILNGVIVSEGIRNAQRLTGKKDITGDDMRRGLESLRVSEARLAEMGLARLRRTVLGELHRP